MYFYLEYKTNKHDNGVPLMNLYQKSQKLYSVLPLTSNYSIWY